MVVRVATVAFEGIEARPVDVQVQIANGNVVFTVVGLGDKAVAESRERVRAALNASGLAMPAKRVTVNDMAIPESKLTIQIKPDTYAVTLI
jgi:magnesium chelatase family protein